VATDTAPSVYETGNVAATGSFICLDCSFVVALSALDSVPECPTCGGSSFRRASLFEQPTLSEQPPVENDPEEPRWLRRLRSETEEQGQFLAFEDEDGDVSTIPVPEGWTRIGRSITADIRLDDPTVSRRHALIVKTDSDELRVLDDRSLNGLFVNGEQVDWSPLDDGDELAIGRYRLHVIDTDARRRPLDPETLRA
jgi:FHA domain-containing protein/zinc ribbon family protein